MNNGLPDIVKDPKFRRRRFLNWFPLGLIYAFYYMGRYNISIASPVLCAMFAWSNAQWGTIITAGFWTYAFAVLVNGPLTDKIGGKRAIILGALGSITINLILGLLIGFNLGIKLLVAFTLLYSINMYCQSFGALSIVKVNAPWFHVNERGVFGGIFGMLISFGLQLAYGVGGVILANFDVQYVFIIPALLLLLVVVIGNSFIKDSPVEAGFPPFDTGDATSTVEKEFKLIDLIKLILSSKTIVILALAEFCTGIVRNGIMQWFPKYMNNVFGIGKHDFIMALFLGTGLMLSGILGGLIGGIISDKLFNSRRPPVAGIFYFGMAVGLISLGLAKDPIVALIAALVTSFFFIGTHGLLSGTASMDFGGKKAAATVAGLIDGFVYFGSGFAGFFLGYAVDKLGWGAWAYLMVPFALIGLILTLFIWNEKPKSRGGH